MVYSTKRPSSSELEDTVYACRSCGAELIRTSVRQAPRAGCIKTSRGASRDPYKNPGHRHQV
jgi:hypothetical protein